MRMVLYNPSYLIVINKLDKDTTNEVYEELMTMVKFFKWSRCNK